MSDKMLAEIARNVLGTFLIMLGIIPSKGEDTLEVLDYGPHRVYTQQARVPDELADSIDPAETLDKLVSYLDRHNDLPAAVRFYPYNAKVYICPCGCGTYLYVSIYHDA